MTKKDIIKWKNNVIKEVEEEVAEKRTNGKPLTFKEMEEMDDALTYKRLLEADIENLTDMHVKKKK